MSTFALYRNHLTRDEVIRNHSRHAVSGLTYSPLIDGMSEDPDAARDSYLSERLAELTGAVLDVFENAAVDVDVLVDKLVQYTTAVVAARPLIHCDELVDDLYTTWSNGMTTGNFDIDQLLAETFPRV